MNNLIAFGTLVRKEWIRVVRIWPQTLLPSVITMTLYFLIFGTFIGSQVSEMKGFSYMEFIVPGLIMMAVITNSYSNTVSSFYITRFQKSIEEILIAPVSNHVIILGFTFGGMLRSLGVGVLVTLVSLFFTELQLFSIFWILVMVLLTSFMLSVGGIINAILARKFDDLGLVTTFFLSPLTFLGGVFYSIDLLPPLFQTLSKFNPLLYIVNGFRYGFLGVSDVNIYISLGIVVFTSLVVYIVCYAMFEKGIGLKH